MSYEILSGLAALLIACGSLVWTVKVHRTAAKQRAVVDLDAKVSRLERELARCEAEREACERNRLMLLERIAVLTATRP